MTPRSDPPPPRRRAGRRSARSEDPIEDLVDELVPVTGRSGAARPARRGVPSLARARLLRSPSRVRPIPPPRSGDRCTAGAAPTDVRAWLGTTWRAVYPAVVQKLGADGLADDAMAGVPAPERRAGAGCIRAAAGQRRQAARADRGRGRRARCDRRSDARRRRPHRCRDAGSRCARRRRGDHGAGRRRIRPDRPRSARDRDLRSCECIGRDGSAQPRPGGLRAPDRGLGDRQRHPEPLAPPAGRRLGRAGRRRRQVPA